MQVYEAIGRVRQVFVGLSKEVVKCLNDNNNKLQDSGSFVELSLFMIGKSTDRTKPMVMLVSDGSNVRREAFRMIKNRDIMKSYPGFGLGHMDLKAEYENLRPLGDSGIPATIQTRPRSPPTASPSSQHASEIVITVASTAHSPRLGIVLRDTSSAKCRRATAGGLVSYDGRLMVTSVSHIFDGGSTMPAETLEAQALHGINDTTDPLECEVTDISDFEDDQDEDQADVTSRGSMGPGLDCVSPDESS